ncbi:hypothetical protein ABPG72_008860 [Tetrahymena utriculariae]
MDYQKKRSLYCHYYHTNQGCWAALHCKFIRGTKKYYCPNGNNCPVKAPHENTPQNDRTKSRERERNYDKSEYQNFSKKKRSKSFSESQEKEIKEAIVQPEDQKIFDSMSDEIKQILKYYYSKCQEATNFLINYYQLFSDIHLFLPIYSRMFPNNQLDLCFIVDCTGSMKDWINSVRQEISGIIAAIKYAFKTNQTRMSFVGYRDFTDDERFAILDFTDDLLQFKNFVDKIQAFGGGDEPEDLAGGFAQANKLYWKNEAKLAVLITDAPAHGQQYHGLDGYYDHYINENPEGIDLKEQFNILLKKGVSLYVVEITGTTKVMFQKFQQYQLDYSNQPLQILKLGSSTNGFAKLVTEAAQKTITETYSQTQKEDPQNAFSKVLKILQDQNTVQSIQIFEKFNLKQYKEKEDLGNDKAQNLKQNSFIESNLQKQNFKEINLKLDPSKSFRDLSKHKPYDAICLSYFIVEDKGAPINWKKPLVQNSSIKTILKIDSLPFAEGSMRYAFYAYDTFLNQKLVAKVSKKYFLDDLEQNKMNLVRDLEAQYICQHIPKNMNQSIYSMCYLCKEPFKTIAKYVYNQRKNYQEKYCDTCDTKKRQTMQMGVCEICYSTFTSSVYWFLMKRTEFPKLCSKCRRNRRDQLRDSLQQSKENY